MHFISQPHLNRRMEASSEPERGASIEVASSPRPSPPAGEEREKQPRAQTMKRNKVPRPKIQKRLCIRQSNKRELCRLRVANETGGAYLRRGAGVFVACGRGQVEAARWKT